MTEHEGAIHGQRVRPGKGHEPIRREALQDERLSFKALGLLTYLLSLPDNWKTNAERLGVSRPGKEGQHAVRTGLRELEQAGYLLRERVHLGGGKWQWIWAYTDDPEALEKSQVRAKSGFPPIRIPPRGMPPRGKSPHVKDLRGKDLDVNKKNLLVAGPDDGAVAEDSPDLPTADAVSASAAAESHGVPGDGGHPAPSPQPSSSQDQNPPGTPQNGSRQDVDQLCAALQDHMVGNGCLRPTITATWRKSTRLLLDKDRRPLEEALDLLAWCQADEFWRSNILSMPKFRQQYDRLRLRWLDGNPVRRLRSDETIKNWLRDEWQKGHYKQVAARSGLNYRSPQLPDEIKTPDEANEWHRQQIRAWITANQDEIIDRIKQAEARSEVAS